MHHKPVSQSLVRFATEADLPAMLAIYTPYVENTTVSFEYTPPAPEVFAARFAARAGVLPWLACEREGRVVGYAYASPFGEREAYAWSCEVSIYIDGAARQTGAGRALYTALHALLRAQGYANAYAKIATPNPESEGFHRRMGYVRQGLLTGVGCKFGRFVDVSYYALQLQALGTPSAKPLPLALLSAEEAQRSLDNPPARLL